MPDTVNKPLAVRATAFIGPSKWLNRPVRLVRYDAYWANGRVDFDVSLSKMMYRGYPADFATVDWSVHAHCPETGTGKWVDEAGRVVEGLTEPGPNPPGDVRGTPRKYEVSRDGSNATPNRAWRLGLGLAGLGLGAFLTIGPTSDGPAGFVGVLCWIFGLGALAGLIPGKHRPW